MNNYRIAFKRSDKVQKVCLDGLGFFLCMILLALLFFGWAALTPAYGQSLEPEYSVDVNGTDFKVYFSDSTVINAGGGLVAVKWTESTPRAEGGVITEATKTYMSPYWVYNDSGWPTVFFFINDIPYEFFIVDSALIQAMPESIILKSNGAVFGGG